MSVHTCNKYRNSDWLWRLVDTSTNQYATWMKWRQVTGVLCDRRMPTHLKSKVYRSIVRPVAQYGSQCKTTTAKEAQMLHVAEMKILRWALNITRLDHVTIMSPRCTSTDGSGADSRESPTTAATVVRTPTTQQQRHGDQTSNADRYRRKATTWTTDDQVREDLRNIGAT